MACDSTETRDYVMAKRVKDAEVIGNKSNLNPLQAAFAYFDSTASSHDTFKLITKNLKSLLVSGHAVEDAGGYESNDRDRMQSIQDKIRKLEKPEKLQDIENDNVDDNASNRAKRYAADFVESVRGELQIAKNEDEKERIRLNKEREYSTINKLKFTNEPITLPNRHATWKHLPKENNLESLDIRLQPLASADNVITNKSQPSTSNSNNLSAFRVIRNDPQKILDEKNEKKTALMIDTFLLGYADMLCLTSAFLKDEYGMRKGPLMIPLLSIYLTDVTDEVFLNRHKTDKNDIFQNSVAPTHTNSNDHNIYSSLDKEDMLRLATFTKNRIFRLHLEYGVGDHVLRWDLEKDTKALIILHKRLQRKNPKDQIIDITRRRETDIPRFPQLPSHFAKFRGLFKGDREFIIANKDNIKHSERGGRSIRSVMTDFPRRSMHTQDAEVDAPLPESASCVGTSAGSDSFDDPPEPLERQATNQSVISDSARSVAHTLTRFSTVAFGSRKRDKVKEREKFKERDKEKLERQNMAVLERLKLNQKYRDDVQAYFDALLEAVSFKEQTNKVLQFFELSPFSLLLSNEIYRKRKEGYLFVVSAASKQGWRVSHFRFHDLSEMVKRHTSKWCIMGDSFIMYTSNIISTTPEEVFLIDWKTKITVKGLSSKHEHAADHPSDYYTYNINEGLNDNVNDENDNEEFIDEPNFLLKNPKSYPTIKLTNSERTIMMLATNPKITLKWASTLKTIINESDWSKPHRFNSFAPVRNDAFAQWFVDARDYWYAASAAIEMAKDVIYIHDWWLSPELYLRRPANGNQNWRIDRLLERKASQGVKIFIIIYRNVGNTVVTDSMYTKHSLLELHENIYVLRSPNQIMQNVFFWAHHEKLLIIDHSVCFLGGVDLCFGRYDTPDHVLVDDSKHAFQCNKDSSEGSVSTTLIDTSSTHNDIHPQQSPNIVTDDDNADVTEENPLNYSSEFDFQEQFQVFPGKDYSNPRKKDFFELTQPHDDMYDRQRIPRMPWHDVHMVTSGQVARDLSRHFIQRWNYLLRQKRPSRPTPMLVPPRPFTDDELSKLKLKGTCEIQLLRSSGEWSLGLKEHEQSIQNAYIKCIEQSEHFVYIENQFFITSCTIDSCVVKNQIGDALVDRIITAHKNGEVWRAIIVIPLMPGFEAEVDTKEGGSVRLIMQCQYMSISMGETSIFARLRRVGIRPEDHISFFSLRKWGLISDKKLLTTEQLYIHAKTMIVDDRIAIIGSANINERSMRGNRDSEVCAIVRDKDLIESKMDGKTYHVGNFAHSLRVRLMREHLGIDVDLVELVERRFKEIEEFCKTEQGLKAAVLNSSEGKQSLSAMVEMGTRYLLGLFDGTPGFIDLSSNGGDHSLREQLTKEMIAGFSTIKNETDDSKSLDEIEFSFSFNHRAGNENAGLRSDKNFSTDTRVKGDSHRNEVRGEIDGFNSQCYAKAKAQINKFLVEKVNQCKQDLHNLKEEAELFNDGRNPLPDYEDILDVLSQNVIKDATVKEHNSINVDRWTMIKRLFYMKKLYMKALIDYNNARSALNQSTGRSGPDSNISGSGITTHNSNSNSTTSNEKSSGNDSGESPSQNHEKSTGSHASDADKSKVRLPDVSLSKLSNEHIIDIDKNLLPQVDYEFIDPYGFEDPLDIKFLEGTWMSQAIRNSLLYQLVFHVQPDDVVQTWSDYKEFEELRKAFDVYQDFQRGNSTNSMVKEAGDSKSNSEADQGTIDLGESELDVEIDVEKRRRRMERGAKLAELERFQRITGQIGGSMLGVGGYGRNTVYDYESSLKLMRLVKGNVVMFPTRWLKKEVEGSNWFYRADKIPPIQIYN